ncbi:MAG: hypothetical protein BGO98_00120 [Myxococcales bacterium 68-20]|nr:MAG: hypothetical protein BGO98_00120 [Myxococcales bacterium 68-20]
MRSALLTGSALTFIALTCFACSGSDSAASNGSEDVLAPPKNESPSTEESSSAESNPPEDSDPTGGGGGGDGSGLPDGGSEGGGGGGGNGNGNGNGGGKGDGGGGGGGGGGSLCQAGSVAESEPNDDAASADSIPGETGTFCGRIGSDTDVDFVTFTLPANAKSFGMSQKTTSGAIRIEPSVDGTTFPFGGGNYPFKPGKAYTLKISTTGGALDYRIGVTITL